jgi:hypothetical protein
MLVRGGTRGNTETDESEQGDREDGFRQHVRSFLLKTAQIPLAESEQIKWAFYSMAFLKLRFGGSQPASLLAPIHQICSLFVLDIAAMRPYDVRITEIGGGKAVWL